MPCFYLWLEQEAVSPQVQPDLPHPPGCLRELGTGEMLSFTVVICICLFLTPFLHSINSVFALGDLIVLASINGSVVTAVSIY